MEVANYSLLLTAHPGQLNSVPLLLFKRGHILLHFQVNKALGHHVLRLYPSQPHRHGDAPSNASLSPRKPKQNGLPGSPLPEGFVRGSEPADVAAGTEEDQPEDGQTKIGPVASSDPPRQARDYVHR